MALEAHIGAKAAFEASFGMDVALGADIEEEEALKAIIPIVAA